MKTGIHLAYLTYPGGPQQLGPDLARMVRTCDDIGVDRVSVMDHVWQIGPIGPAELDMVEAYTALGFLAAHSTKVKLLTLVTGVTYRDPGLLAKAVTTLDVLSGGRAMLGIGAAWNEEESRGLGLFFPPTAERFERLEETLQIFQQMWSDSEEPYRGKHYQLGRTLNSPQPLTRPHPPILIGGGGEKKTLRLVAQYAQSTNLFAGPEVAHKLQVLREHCDRLGTDYDAIEKTVTYRFDLVGDGAVERTLEELRALHDLGITVAHGGLPDITDGKQLEILGTKIIPEIATW